MSETTRFNVGDEVTWNSQARGYRREKRGTVGEVVGPGYYPDREQWPSLFRGSGVGLARDHESYVVVADGKTYWPLVKNLQATNAPRMVAESALLSEVAEWLEQEAGDVGGRHPTDFQRGFVWGLRSKADQLRSGSWRKGRM